MKYILMLITIGISSIAYANEFIQMNNGMTCWRNNSGYIYGCSGGVSTGNRGFNDVQKGTRYEITGPNNAVNTRTGQSISIPQIKQRDDGNRNNYNNFDNENEKDFEVNDND